MRFDWCKANLHTSCEEHKYDHCEMCNMARAYQHGYETAQEDMSKDAVEVVRCKDCRFSEIFQNDSSGVMAMYCRAFTLDRMIAEDDFCSYGERREESGVEG